MSFRAGEKLFLAFFLNLYYTIKAPAGVLELVDEEDSKSFGLIPRAGSIPATGTKNCFDALCFGAIFLLPDRLCPKSLRVARRNGICRRDLTGKIQMCVILFPD